MKTNMKSEKKKSMRVSHNKEVQSKKRKENPIKKHTFRGKLDKMLLTPDLHDINDLSLNSKGKTKILHKRKGMKKETDKSLELLPTLKYPVIDSKYNGKDISADKVREGVNALLDLLVETNNSRNPFCNEWEDIYMQITSFKAPQQGLREIRVLLPHSLLTDSAEVCLFTADLEKQSGSRVNYEPTVEHVKENLRNKGVTKINEVIPLQRLRTEFDQFEMKRALCSRYDIFLSEAKVCGHIMHYLGKTFYARRKVPVPVDLNAKNLVKHIENALHKSSFRINPCGTVSALKVATTRHTAEQIFDNIMATITALTDCYPGGWENILSLMIKGAKSIPVPLYMSTRNESTVQVPEPRKTRYSEPVYGELFGEKISVDPDGTVNVISEDELEEWEKTVDTRAEFRRQQRQKKKLKKQQMKAHDSHTDNEDGGEGGGGDDDDDDDDNDNYDHLTLEDEEKKMKDLDETMDASYSSTRGGHNEAEKGKTKSNAKIDDDDDDNDIDVETGLSALEMDYLGNWKRNEKSSKKRCK